MIPAKAWADDMATELAAGLTTLIGGAFRVYPILANYAPSADLVLADLVLGSGTLGQKFRNVPAAAAIDAESGLPKIYIPTRNGGWTWQYDGITPAPPKTVFGYAFVNAANSLLLATSPRLTVPIVLAGPALFLLGEVSGLLSDVAIQ